MQFLSLKFCSKGGKKETMKKTSYFVLCMLLMLVGFFIKPTYAADWRFPVGLTYINGFGDVVDIYEDNLKAEGYIVDTSWEFPVGISFQPYVQLDNGVRFGAGVGPIAFIAGDASFYDIPVNINAGYIFFPSANISPYVRGGLMCHIAGGDYVEGRSIGLFGGIGVEFSRKESVSFGVELSYDTSEIEFEKYNNNSNYWWNSNEKDTKDIRPYGLMFSIFVIF